jgi:hypothetical protein
MFKGVLVSVVILPVLLGMAGGRMRRESHGLVLLVGSLFIFDVLYLLLLYYLRVKWVG